jgi:exopolyphosphatase/pppGpp-phosphohydrolase
VSTDLDPGGLLRLQNVAAELARALASERRRRRRHEAAVQQGSAHRRLAARLERSTRRVGELLEVIEPLLAAARMAIWRDADASHQAAPATSRPTISGGRPAPGAVIAAAVDIGSNSVHLLVAAVSGHRLEPLHDVSEFLGLGEAVDERHELGPELRSRLAQTLAGYVARARTLGAPRPVLVGTHPMRDAADAAEAIREIEAATGEPVSIITHEEEAFLTLLGVTAGRPVRRNLILVDVGGGSSEVLWVPIGGEPVAAGLPLGSAGLTRRIVRHDPPTAVEVADLQREARRVMEAAPSGQPDDVVVVGGSATNLLRMFPAAVIDRRLTSTRVKEALRMLGVETAAQAAARHGMREPRARTMAAGAAIVGAVLDRYAAERARVDEAGIREGLLLATTQSGAAWRENLVWLAHGWSR